MNQFDYNLVYETARIFAKRYSEEIVVQDKTQESVFANGIEPDYTRSSLKMSLES